MITGKDILVKMTPEDIAEAVAEGTRRQTLNSKRRDAHGMEKGKQNPMENHQAAAVAEKIVSNLLGLPWTGKNSNDWKGPDVGTNIQVRFTDLVSGQLIFRPDRFDEDTGELTDRGDNPDHVYVLVIRLPFLFDGCSHKVVGWITGHEAKKFPYHGTKTRPQKSWWVPQESLHPFPIPAL